MKLKEIMTKDPAVCFPESNLQEVAHLMIEKDCGAIPIVENLETKRPVGIITDRDIACNTIGVGKNALQMAAAEIMTFPVVTLTPETTLEECVHKMEENKIRRMLVVDNNGACCGIVAQADIARAAPIIETAELLKDVSMAHAA